MKNLDNVLSVFYLGVAILELLVLHDPAFAIACCAMSGVHRLDAKLEGREV